MDKITNIDPIEINKQFGYEIVLENNTKITISMPDFKLLKDAYDTYCYTNDVKDYLENMIEKKIIHPDVLYSNLMSRMVAKYMNLRNDIQRGDYMDRLVHPDNEPSIHAIRSWQECLDTTIDDPASATYYYPWYDFGIRTKILKAIAKKYDIDSKDSDTDSIVRDIIQKCIENVSFDIGKNALFINAKDIMAKHINPVIIMYEKQLKNAEGWKKGWKT